jgi:hypothetical protein
MRPIYQPTRGRRGEQRDVPVTYSLALRCRLGVVSQLGHRTSTTSSIALGILQVVPTLCFSIIIRAACLLRDTSRLLLRRRGLDPSISRLSASYVRPGDSSSGEKVPSPVAGRRLAGYELLQNLFALRWSHNFVLCARRYMHAHMCRAACCMLGK